MSTERMVACLSMLCEVFNRTPTPATFAAYEIGLGGLPIEAVEFAAAKSLQVCRFMPTPVELRELAGVVGGRDRATLAWEVVLKALRFGAYAHIDFDDRLVNATIRNLGGWVTFVMRFTDVESEKWVRKEFIDTYATLHRAGVDGDSCRPLTGLIEANGVDENGNLVPPVPKVIKVGLPTIAETPALGRRQVECINAKTE